MANRIYWATEAIGIAPLGDQSNIVAVHGAQTAGISTSFNLEQVFEIGQLEIYENIEDLPEIELTLEKVLDGYPLIYHLATRGYAANTLAGRSDRRADVYLSIYGDTQDSASGVSISQVFMSGMYVSSLSYTFPVDGNSTEAVTLVGNNKICTTNSTTFAPDFTNDDLPPSGVQRRQHIVWDSNSIVRDANGQVVSNTCTILPREIQGISSSGTNDSTLGERAAHVQSITVSVDLGRENLNELGRRGPYFRFITFPTEVTTEIETTATESDGINAIEASESNLTNQSIRVFTHDGTFIYTGLKNKLSSVSYGGGEAGGGNRTISYSYSTFNTLVVTHPADVG